MKTMKRILLAVVCSFLQSLGLIFLFFSLPMFLWEVVAIYAEFTKDDDMIWLAKKMTLITIPFALLARVGLYILDVAQDVEAKLV